MPAEHTKKFLLCEDVLDRIVMIGRVLEEAKESRLIQFLRNNQDVFAWSSSDLRGVSREVMEHELRVDPKVKPRKQRLRTMSEDRKKSCTKRSSEVTRCWCNPRSTIPKMASKCSHGTKEEWKLENVHRLHHPQQVLPEGRISLASH